MQKPVVNVMVKAARAAGNVLLRGMHKLDAINVVEKDRMDFASMRFPVAEQVTQSTIWISHQFFMGGTDLPDYFVEALERVRGQAAEIKAFFAAQ